MGKTTADWAKSDYNHLWKRRWNYHKILRLNSLEKTSENNAIFSSIFAFIAFLFFKLTTKILQWNLSHRWTKLCSHVKCKINEVSWSYLLQPKNQFLPLSFWLFLKGDGMSQGIIPLKNKWGWIVCTASEIYNTSNKGKDVLQ